MLDTAKKTAATGTTQGPRVFDRFEYTGTIHPSREMAPMTA
jgi:hypothetical protein